MQTGFAMRQSHWSNRYRFGEYTSNYVGTQFLYLKNNHQNNYLLNKVLNVTLCLNFWDIFYSSQKYGKSEET